MKDLKKELERYTRNNYTRKETIERLTMEGFDVSKINEEMSKQLDAADDRIVLNMIYFFPSFIYLFVLMVVAMFFINVLDSVAFKAFAFVVLLAIAFIAIRYYKEKKDAILSVAVLLSGGFIFSAYALITRIFFHTEIPFFTYWAIIPVGFITYFLAKLNYELYKE